MLAEKIYKHGLNIIPLDDHSKPLIKYNFEKRVDLKELNRTIRNASSFAIGLGKGNLFTEKGVETYLAMIYSKNYDLVKKKGLEEYYEKTVSWISDRGEAIALVYLSREAYEILKELDDGIVNDVDIVFKGYVTLPKDPNKFLRSFDLHSQNLGILSVSIREEAKELLKKIRAKETIEEIKEDFKKTVEKKEIRELEESEIEDYMNMLRTVQTPENREILWKDLCEKKVKELTSPRSMIKILTRLFPNTTERMVYILEESYRNIGISLEKYRRDIEILRGLSRLRPDQDAVKKIFEANERKRVNEKMMLIASAFLDMIKNHFRYIKNFVIENIDLGLYCFDGKRYRPCEKDVESMIQHLYDLFEIDSKGIRYTMLYREIIKMIEDRLREKIDYDPSSISFENCAFSWDNLLCEPHNPERNIYHHIPHEIDIDLLNNLLNNNIEINEDLVNKYVPKTLKIFKEWAGGKWILLFEIIGFVLYPRPYKKFVILTDQEGKTGDTGKSSYLKYLGKILGSENFSSIPIQAFQDPIESRFLIGQIYRKLANIYADLPKGVLREFGLMKMLTGEDYIMIDRKHKEGFKWLPYTKHIFSANELPPLGEIDMAFMNRVLIVEFKGLFREKMRFEDLYDTIKDEIPKVLALGITLFNNVLKKGSFSFENTPEDAKNLWLSKSDSVYAFMNWLKTGGALIENRDGRIPINDLYPYYTRYCEKYERDPVAQKDFTSRLKKLGYMIKQPHGYSTIYGYILRKDIVEKLLKGEESEDQKPQDQNT
jgi:phage/plasmid-associated DNA primase